MFVCSHLQRTMSTKYLTIIVAATTATKRSINYLLDNNEKGDNSMMMNARARNKARDMLFYVVRLQLFCVAHFFEMSVAMCCAKSANVVNANHVGTSALVIAHL